MGYVYVCLEHGHIIYTSNHMTVFGISESENHCPIHLYPVHLYPVPSLRKLLDRFPRERNAVDHLMKRSYSIDYGPVEGAQLH